ncbi:MAG: cytochrome c family protein [Acidobacteria bacterium]|nr:cytochrome c family protein [Acidobacteriota bacterium]MBI3662674.1 cytochrome c family protein [Acidobacteriota bacterium]
MKRFSWRVMLGFMFVSSFLLLQGLNAQYVAAGKCRACHLPQTKSWEQTRMSKAFELLKPGVSADVKRAHSLDPDKDYTHDSNCLSCHVTGYGQAGGFVSLEKTPNLVGVQCEACHGPGAGYLKPEMMSLQNKEYKRSELVATGLVVPTAATCQQCHNKKSPFFKPFDFSTRVHEGTHVHEPLKYKHD